jgi:ferrous iron transport protein A
MDISSDAQGSETRLRLFDLSSGERGRVRDLVGDTNLCSRLREMGFCEDAIVQKVSGDYTLLCQVCGTRIALNGGVAKHIVVEKIA